VLETIPANICVFDPEGRTIAASRRVLDYAGLELGEFHAWASGSSLPHPDDADEAGAAWARALQTGEDFQRELRMRRADGAYRWHLAEASPLREADARISHWVGVLVDIHERKMAEEAAGRSNDLLGRITSLLPANVAYIDSDERYRFANESYRAFYGIDPASLLGKRVREFIGRRAYAEIEPAMRRPFQATCGDRGWPGVAWHSRFARTPRTSDDGAVRSFVSLVTDVTSSGTRPSSRANAEPRR
jgi:PAS domain S-box-containing protein